MAKKKQQQRNSPVIAVLFRDSDGTRAYARGDWQHKIDSVLAGFSVADFDHGISMIPKLKSEAWLLCVLRNGYQHCEKLESESGNENSPSNLKAQLEPTLGQHVTREYLCQLVEEEKN